MPRLTPIAAAAAFASLVASAAAEPARYEVDPRTMFVTFNVDHVGYGSVYGMFLKGGGHFVFDEEANELSEVEIVIRADSVFTNDQQRDNHLRSPDFLSAEAHPDIRFVLAGAEASTDTTGTVTGDLTLRGETHPVTAEVELHRIGPYPFDKSYRAGVTARATIRRSDWGSTYAVDNGWVGDEVPLTIRLEGVRVED